MVPVSAETGASVTVVSDYRFRGVSLSDEQPSAQLNFTYDNYDGWYAGATLAGVKLAHSSPQGQVLTYFGYARREASGLSWETGATVVGFTDDSDYSYGEVYAGFSTSFWNARLYFSPDYYGLGERTGYAELNAQYPLNASVRLFGHVGGLGALGGAHGTRVDTRAGASVGMDRWELAVTWGAVVGSVRPYAPVYENHHQSWVLSAALFF